ncbi:helix-turn-helix domain-containing protein [Megasphaera sp.]|uniref:helix-turn-helix domain-containing protein n=1 Tax=Megasphaera sp. TaxID=2023260 RepID=UPI003F0C67A3
MPVQITLRAARVNAGLTIIQAAKAIGVGKDRIIKWEKTLACSILFTKRRFPRRIKSPLTVFFLDNN